MYYIDNGLTYLKIEEIIEINKQSFKANINWFTRPGMTYLFSTVETIDYKTFRSWKIKYDGTSNISESLAQLPG
jgi:hypothetical protein